MGPLLVLCTLSAMSVRFNADADDSSLVAVSAVSVVTAAAIVAFHESSPVLGPLVVAMCNALWRVPRTRRDWFTIPGNFGVAGLPALAAAALYSAIAPTGAANALTLIALALPISLTYALSNGALMAIGISLQHHVRFTDALRHLVSTAGGVYCSFVFGAFTGALSLRSGIVVFALAAATFVMIQAVFNSYRELVASEKEALQGLVAAVERKDPYTAGHSLRVQKFARYMGLQLGFRGKRLAQLEQHALMHDIGKLAVPNHVLRKPGRLDADERDLMLRHEAAGEAMLSAVPFLALGADIAKGEDRRNLEGRARASHIVHAADAFDAMTSTRAYRKAHDQADAFNELRAKSGVDFHPDVVTALITEIDKRDEVYGAGHEQEVTVYDVAPPEAALGHTLDDQAAADTSHRPRRPQVDPRPPAPPSTGHDRETTAIVGLTAIAIVAAAIAALAGSAASVAVPVALASLIAIGELVCLRPVGRAPRPLSLVVMLVALRALPPLGAAFAIGAGQFAAVGLRNHLGGDREHDRPRPLGTGLVTSAAMVVTYALLSRSWPGLMSTAALLGTMILASVAALATQDLLITGRVQFDKQDRLADLAIVACGPLVALGTAGTPTVPGLGLGAFVVLMVPLGLLAHGYARTQRAHDNMFAWMRAVSLAPEHAGIVVPGRAERVARYARGIARRIDLDDDTADQLEAAAWMERVGECCLDETYITGQPHRPDEVVEESAAILKSSQLFYPAGQILWASLNEPELATDTVLDLAGQILRVAIAFEDTTNGDIERARIPQLIAELRTSAIHPVIAELADQLQQVVAPGTHRSTWQPVRTHAELTCGCVTSVDDYSMAGDDVVCVVHGEARIAALAHDAVRDALDFPELAESATARLLDHALGCSTATQRELYVRTLPTARRANALTPIARAGFTNGYATAGLVATWLREAGASPGDIVEILTDAGAPPIDVFDALQSAGYDEADVDHLEGLLTH